MPYPQAFVTVPMMPVAHLVPGACILVHILLRTTLLSRLPQHCAFKSPPHPVDTDLVTLPDPRCCRQPHSCPFRSSRSLFSALRLGRGVWMRQRWIC